SFRTPAPLAPGITDLHPDANGSARKLLRKPVAKQPPVARPRRPDADWPAVGGNARYSSRLESGRFTNGPDREPPQRRHHSQWLAGTKCALPGESSINRIRNPNGLLRAGFLEGAADRNHRVGLPDGLE